MSHEELFAQVCQAEGLAGWSLEWYESDAVEGYCWRSLQTIRIGPANENVPRLILHELAHALTQPTCPGHGAEFWRVYRRLLDTHLRGVEFSESDYAILRAQVTFH